MGSFFECLNYDRDLVLCLKEDLLVTPLSYYSPDEDIQILLTDDCPSMYRVPFIDPNQSLIDFLSNSIDKDINSLEDEEKSIVQQFRTMKSIILNQKRVIEEYEIEVENLQNNQKENGKNDHNNHEMNDNNQENMMDVDNLSSPISSSPLKNSSRKRKSKEIENSSPTYSPLNLSPMSNNSPIIPSPNISSSPLPSQLNSSPINQQSNSPIEMEKTLPLPDSPNEMDIELNNDIELNSDSPNSPIIPSPNISSSPLPSQLNSSPINQQSNSPLIEPEKALPLPDSPNEMDIELNNDIELNSDSPNSPIIPSPNISSSPLPSQLNSSPINQQSNSPIEMEKTLPTPDSPNEMDIELNNDTESSSDSSNSPIEMEKTLSPNVNSQLNLSPETLKPNSPIEMEKTLSPNFNSPLNNSLPVTSSSPIIPPSSPIINSSPIIQSSPINSQEITPQEVKDSSPNQFNEPENLSATYSPPIVPSPNTPPSPLPSQLNLSPETQKMNSIEIEKILSPNVDLPSNLIPLPSSPDTELNNDTEYSSDSVETQSDSESAEEVISPKKPFIVTDIMEEISALIDKDPQSDINKQNTNKNKPSIVIIDSESEIDNFPKHKLRNPVITDNEPSENISLPVRQIINPIIEPYNKKRKNPFISDTSGTEPEEENEKLHEKNLPQVIIEKEKNFTDTETETEEKEDGHFTQSDTQSDSISDQNKNVIIEDLTETESEESNRSQHQIFIEDKIRKTNNN